VEKRNSRERTPTERSSTRLVFQILAENGTAGRDLAQITQKVQTRNTWTTLDPSSISKNAPSG
jgi:hypothetical protein